MAHDMLTAKRATRGLRMSGLVGIYNLLVITFFSYSF